MCTGGWKEREMQSCKSGTIPFRATGVNRQAVRKEMLSNYSLSQEDSYKYANEEVQIFYGFSVLQTASYVGKIRRQEKGKE
jgi:hypothetical protein